MDGADVNSDRLARVRSPENGYRSVTFANDVEALMRISGSERHEPRFFFPAYGFSPPERSERRIGTPNRPKVSRRPFTR